MLENKARVEIVENDVCKSELSGKIDGYLECAQLFHENKNPDMQLYVTATEHLAHHLMFECNPRDIGMTKSSNKEAINTLLKKIHNNPDINITREEIGEAINLWELFYQNLKHR